MNLSDRKGMKGSVMWASVALALVVSLQARAGQAEPPAPIKPVTTFNVLMVRFVDQASDAIWDAATSRPRKPVPGSRSSFTRPSWRPLGRCCVWAARGRWTSNGARRRNGACLPTA